MWEIISNLINISFSGGDLFSVDEFGVITFIGDVDELPTDGNIVLLIRVRFPHISLQNNKINIFLKKHVYV